MVDEQIQFEPVIGHHVEATETKTEFRRQLDEVAEDLGLTPLSSRPIEITVGDVAWDNTKTVKLRLETLEKIVDHFEEE